MVLKMVATTTAVDAITTRTEEGPTSNPSPDLLFGMAETVPIQNNRSNSSPPKIPSLLLGTGTTITTIQNPDRPHAVVVEKERKTTRDVDRPPP